MDLKSTFNRVLGGGAASGARKVRAVWDGAVLAESDQTVIVEGNHYFPADSVDHTHLRDSSEHSVCAWKGTASYFDVVVGDKVNRGAAWYYPVPKAAAAEIRGRIAFWRGVRVEPMPAEVSARG